MAVRGGTVVAVGRRSPQLRNERLDLAEPLAWWSTDQGETWHGASVPGKGGLRAVAAVQAGFVAVGEIVEAAGCRAVVLASENGRTWTEESVAGLTDVVFDTIAVTPRGPILAGYRFGTEGIEPFALVRSAPAGWPPTVLPGRIANGHAQIRGGCVRGDDVVLVGRVVADDGTRTPLVVRSSDRGDTWVTVRLPGVAITGPDSLANGCAFVSGRLAVVGETLLEDGYGRAFVSLETLDGWAEPDLLEPSATWPGHSVATRVVSMGADLAVVGEMTLGESGRDLAVWYGAAAGGCASTPSKSSVSAPAPASPPTSSPSMAWSSSAGPPRIAPWCSGRRPVGLSDRLSPQPSPCPPPVGPGTQRLCRGTQSEGLGWPSTEESIPASSPTLRCSGPSWAPSRWCRRSVPRPAWSSSAGGSRPMATGSCHSRSPRLTASTPSRRPIPPRPCHPGRSPTFATDARYYGRVQTAMARCGDMTVTIGGLPQEQATVLLRAVTERLRG